MADSVRETGTPTGNEGEVVKSKPSMTRIIKLQKDTKPRDHEKPCPLCHKPFKQTKRARAINCSHSFCYEFINEYLDPSAVTTSSGAPPCLVYRGETTNVAHYFDTQGNFRTFFNKAKIWSAYILDVDFNRFTKKDGKFYQALDSTQLRIMQADGTTTVDLGRKMILFRDLRKEEYSDYRDSETDPVAAPDFQKVTEEIEKNLRLHGRVPHPPIPGLSGRLTSLHESKTRTVLPGAPSGTAKAETPSLTEEIRRILGDFLLEDFDTSISNVVDSRILYIDKASNQVGRKVTPLVLGSVRTLQTLDGFLFDKIRWGGGD